MSDIENIWIKLYRGIDLILNGRCRH